MFTITSEQITIEIEDFYQLLITNKLSFNEDLPPQNYPHFEKLDIQIQFCSNCAIFTFNSKTAQQFFNNNKHLFS